jgi:Dyp-type peroxidase family
VSEPLIDVDDLQGHIWPGFGATDAVLLALSAGTPEALRAVLAIVLPSVTTARVALGQRAARKMAFQSGTRIRGERNAAGIDTPDPLRAAVSFTRRGLDLAGMTERGVDRAFDSGMTGGGTGDPKKELDAQGSSEPAHPKNWVVGGPNRPFDVLVVFITEDNVSARCQHLEQQIAGVSGVTVVHRDVGEDLRGSREHFGFQDGISMPGLYGEYPHSVHGLVPVTTRYGVPPVGGMEFGKPGQPLVWPGRFIVGSPAFSGEAPADDGSDWNNGSFLVYRRLVQDVRAFYDDTEAMAIRLADKVPSVTGAQVREFIVGRTQDGQSLMRVGAGEETTNSINHFFYAMPTPPLQLGEEHIAGVAEADVVGKRCPFWAHVRKVNPRDGQSDLSEETRNLQLLRRGVPFGPAYDHDDEFTLTNKAERGLLFLSYQRHISEQFESLNSHWMNQFDVPAGGGHDLLVGQPLKSGAFTERRADWPGTEEQLVATRNWVHATGGAYLFAPSLATLNKVATAGP